MTKPRKLTIKAGCWYARKDGSVHGPMESRTPCTAGSPFVWKVKHGDAYCADGGYYRESPSDYDLIKEVPAPHAKPAKAKARKRKAVRAFLVHYFNNGRPQDGILVARMSSMKNAIEYCKNMTLNNYTCGPITKISIPAPSGEGKT